MKIIIYLLTILLVRNNVFSQTISQSRNTYEIEYSEVQKIDTLHLRGMSKEQIDLLKEYARGKKAILKTNGLQSEYNISTNNQKKTIKTNADELNASISIFNPKQPSMIYYKDLTKDSLYLLANNTGENLIVTRSSKSYEWQLLKDTLSIGGLLTRKAINNEGDTAFYSDAYPIFDGPRAYWGLPGLIIKIDTKSMVIQVKKIEKSLMPLTIKFSRQFEMISWEEFGNRINNIGIPGKKNGVKSGKTVSKNGTTTTTTTIQVKKTTF